MKRTFSILFLALLLVATGCSNNDEDFENLKNQIASLKTQLDSLTTLQSSVSTLKSSVDSQLSNLSSLSDKLSALDTKVDGVTSSLSTSLTSELDKLKADTSKLIEDLTSIKEKLETLEGHIGDIVQSSSNNGENLTKLQETLNSELQKLKDDLALINEKIVETHQSVENSTDNTSTTPPTNQTERVGFDPSTVETILEAGADNLPSELGNAGDNERGFSLNSTHAYVADKGDGKIYFWNNDGSSTSASSLKDENSIVSGGAWKLADVIATENGILGSNMNWAGGPFKVYRWNDNDSNPEVLLEYPTTHNGNNIRLGDAINFHGDPQGDGTLYVVVFPGFNSIPNNNFVLKWNLENGQVVNADSPDVITFEGLNRAGNYGYVEHIAVGDMHYLLVNGGDITPTLYSTDGSTKLTNIGTDAITNRTFGGEVFDFNGKRYLAVATAGSEGSTVRDAAIHIFDVSGDDLVEAFNQLTAETIEDKTVLKVAFGRNINGNQAADIDVLVSENEFHVLAGAANNGFIVIKGKKPE